MLRRTTALALLLSTLLLSSPLRAADLHARAPESSAGFGASGADSPSETRANVPEPEDVLGFRPGEDKKLASWASIVDYFRRLDAASERVRFEELGRTTLGAPFVMATISSPENLARLAEYRRIQDQLADPRTLGRNAERRASELVKRGKAVVLITCGIHSTEVGSTLSSTLIAHRLASGDDAETRKILEETIVLLVPSLNPDGVDIVKRWYDRTLGTPFEGTTPPDLYHKYVGHDNNRDWYAFTQVETQLTVDKIHNLWHPQIVHDIHQQGPMGSRLFLPPYMQPVEPNVPRQLIEGYTELGLDVAKRMLERGFKGITWNSTYDAWTPARAYSHYHGGARILSETASAQLASPMTVKFEQMRSREGYDPQKPSENFPEPWRGGEWKLDDITRYMTTAAFELLGHAARNRERWLRRFYEIGAEAVRPRKTGELHGFLIPPSENRDALVSILRRGGVEVERAAAEGARRQSRDAENSTLFVRMAQPYGAFAKALLERQTYPNLRDPEGNPIAPYDVTAHTLPLLMGVEVEPVYKPVRTAGRVKVNLVAPVARAVRDSVSASKEPARVALYKSHVPSMDEGWTRWILERHGLKHASVSDRDIRAGNLRAKYDAILLPDQSPRALLEGHRKGSMPDELTGGLGKEGVKALREFVEAGGTLVALNEASDFAIEQFDLPVRDATAGLKRTEFYAPGSILRIHLDTAHPLARGMARDTIAWVEDSPVFELKEGAREGERVRVVARYTAEANPLLSGWLLGDEVLRGKGALVEAAVGKGRVVLFGFRPQYRAQSLATYPLLFNALTQTTSAR